MSLDTRFRPATLQQMVGNKTTIAAIQGLFDRRENFPHALLISGPTGCGKTTIGRIITNMLGAKSDDYREIDSAQFNGIDTVREIKNQMRFKPRHPESTCRVWLIDECHMLGTGGASEKNKAQNAILKMLEDAPSHVYFILCTTDPQRLLPTVRGRCTSFEVSTIDRDLMAGLVKKTARREKSPVSDAVVEMIVEKAGGHPRNAMKLLEKVIGLTEEQAQEIIDEEERFTSEGIELCRELLKAKSQTSWSKIAKILSGLKNQDEEGIRRLVLSYCNSILLKQNSLHAFLTMDEFSQPFYDTGKAGLLLYFFQSVFNDERTDIPF